MRSAILAIALCLAVVPDSAAQGGAGGRIIGRVTDSNLGVLPGVSVAVSTADFQRTVVADEEGRFSIGDLPPGAYPLVAELPGFKTLTRQVVVSPGEEVRIDLELKLGCLMHVLYIDEGIADALANSDAIVHLRLRSAAGGLKEWEDGASCVMLGEQSVDILAHLRGSAHAHLVGSARLFVGPTSYQPGDEFVAFLRWSPSVNGFQPLVGGSYMFPVQDGFVRWQRTDLAGAGDGMTIEYLMNLLRQYPLPSPVP